jgi:murein L,D-transpeptidase YafK
MISRWRTRAREVIAEVEQEHRNATLAEFKAALKAAYPFGQRQYGPYKIWCQEQRYAIARFRARTEPQPCTPQTGDLPGLEG